MVEKWSKEARARLRRDVKMTRAAMTQETCDAASKCLNGNNGDPDDRTDKMQTLEGMVEANVIERCTGQVSLWRIY